MKRYFLFVFFFFVALICCAQQTLSNFNVIGKGFPEHQKEIEKMALDYQQDLLEYFYSIFTNAEDSVDVRIIGFFSHENNLSPYVLDVREIFSGEFKRQADEKNSMFFFARLKWDVIDFYEEPLRTTRFEIFGSHSMLKNKGKRYVKFSMMTTMPSTFMDYGVEYPPTFSRTFVINKRLWKFIKKNMESYRR